MKKKLSLVMSVMLIFFTLVGCSNTSTKESVDSSNDVVKEDVITSKDIKVCVPDGLPAISIAKLIKENKVIKDGYNIEYTIENGAESLVTDVMKGEADIAVVPSNVAAIAYNKTEGMYKIAGTTGWGSMYICSNEDINSIEDLKGREIYSLGKGLTPDIITQTVLKDNGIDVQNDVNFSYVNGVTELAPIVLSGKAEVAVLPEPALSAVTTKDESYTAKIDLNKEWKKSNNSEYGFPQATIIVKKELIENDREFVDNILKAVDESTQFVYSDKDTLGTYCEEIGVSAEKAIIVKSIDNSNIKYVYIKDSYKEYETYFEKLNEFDPKTLGGKIPDEEIFMEK